MNENNLVSVIMSTYNENVEWIKLAVDSILNQTYKELEFIIIIDNPNNEEIISYLKTINDERIKLVVNDKNIGLVRSLNKGIELSKGKYIARMDADDISIDTRIEEQVNYLNLHKEICLVGSNMEFIDEYGIKLEDQNKNILTGSDNIERVLKYKNIMNHPTFMFRKSVICDKKINKYRYVKYAEDYDLVCRIVANGYKIDNINKKFLKYRIRNNSITRSNEFYQVKVSLYIADLYKKNKLDKFDLEYMEILINNDKGKKTFYLSNNIKSKVTSNKLKKLINHIIANTISKYHFIRMKNILLLNLNQKNYKIRVK